MCAMNNGNEKKSEVFKRNLLVDNGKYGEGWKIYHYHSVLHLKCWSSCKKVFSESNVKNERSQKDDIFGTFWVKMNDDVDPK